MLGSDDSIAVEPIAARSDETPAIDAFALIQPAAAIDLVYLVELYPYQRDE